MKSLIISIILAFCLVNSNWYKSNFCSYDRNKAMLHYIAMSAIIYFVLCLIYKEDDDDDEMEREDFALDQNQYRCQTKCQQYKDGYVWQWENTQNKNNNMYANCMLECMNINSPMYNMLGYTMDDNLANVYRYTASSP